MQSSTYSGGKKKEVIISIFTYTYLHKYMYIYVEMI